MLTAQQTVAGQMHIMNNNFCDQVCWCGTSWIRFFGWAVFFSSPTYNLTAGFWKRVGFAHLFFSPKLEGQRTRLEVCMIAARSLQIHRVSLVLNADVIFINVISQQSTRIILWWERWAYTSNILKCLFLNILKCVHMFESQDHPGLVLKNDKSLAPLKCTALLSFKFHSFATPYE